MCFNILFMFAFLFSRLFSILIILPLGIVWRIVSPSVYGCIFPLFVQVYRPLPHGGNRIAVNKYHIIFHKAASSSQFISLYFYRITPYDNLLRPSVFKIQQISYTDSHATQTEGQAYNSVPVYLFITSVSLATSIRTPRNTLCQRKVM